MAKTKKSGSPTKGLSPGIHVYRTWIEPRKPIGTMTGKWEYRWVAVAKNHLRICASTEGYDSKQFCIHSIHVAAEILHPVALKGGFGNKYTDHTLKTPKEKQFRAKRVNS